MDAPPELKEKIDHAMLKLLPTDEQLMTQAFISGNYACYLCSMHEAKFNKIHRVLFFSSEFCLTVGFSGFLFSLIMHYFNYEFFALACSLPALLVFGLFLILISCNPLIDKYKLKKSKVCQDCLDSILAASFRNNEKAELYFALSPYILETLCYYKIWQDDIAKDGVAAIVVASLAFEWYCDDCLNKPDNPPVLSQKNFINQ